MKNVARRISQVIADKLVQSSVKLPSLIGRIISADAHLQDCVNSSIKGSPSLTARFLPFMENRDFWVLPKENGSMQKGDDDLPIPPKELWAGYGNTIEDYMLSSHYHFDDAMKILRDNGFVLEESRSILDFGCAAGRLTRRFKDVADSIEVWGTDINAEAILWCQRNLSPPFKFVTTTTFPHLPFEDNFFNLVMAGSVFTHIGDLEDTWLMELRRVMKPGGILYATVHDNHTIKVILSSREGHWLHGSAIQRELNEFDEKTGVFSSHYDMFMTSRDPGNTQVYHDSEFITRRWGEFFKIVAVVPEAYGYQTAVVMTK